MFIALFFTIIAHRWKQPTCPSTDEWINKTWYMHAVEYYSSVKRNEVLTYTKTWMHLGNTTVSEIH